MLVYYVFIYMYVCTNAHRYVCNARMAHMYTYVYTDRQTDVHRTVVPLILAESTGTQHKSGGPT